RTGSWSDITKGETVLEYERVPLNRSYLTIWLDHGTKPTAQAYAYMLLPGASAEQTEAYAHSPSIDIIEQSSEAHAIYHNELKLLCVNFRKDCSATVSDVTCQQKAALLIQETSDEIRIAASDPTHRNEETIEIE